MDIPLVFACSNATVLLKSGGTLRVSFGQHWYANDPVVRANPHLFTSDVRFGLGYSERLAEFDDAEKFPPSYDIEEATANPGEKRSVRRS